MLQRGRLFGLTGRASDAVQMISSGLTDLRSRGAIVSGPMRLLSLASAYADLGRFDDAWGCRTLFRIRFAAIRFCGRKRSLKTQGFILAACLLR
jgi:hypothetical protein